MAYLEFYFSKRDREDLFNFIQLKGGKLIPDIGFKSENYYFINDFEEFTEFQGRETTHFFLIDDHFVLEPLSIGENKYMSTPAYYIYQRKGGPYIDMSFYRGYSDDSAIPYMKSWVEIYSKFVHFDNNNEFKAPDHLKKYYGDIVNYIKDKSKLTKVGTKKYWLSNEVLKELKL